MPLSMWDIPGPGIESMSPALAREISLCFSFTYKNGQRSEWAFIHSGTTEYLLESRYSARFLGTQR